MPPVDASYNPPKAIEGDEIDELEDKDLIFYQELPTFNSPSPDNTTVLDWVGLVNTIPELCRHA